MQLSEKQQYELLAAISARGEIPVKFLYLDEGAQRWDKVYRERFNDGGMTDVEMGLLLKHIDSFTSVFEGVKGINLIDLGCGNGMPAAHIIGELQRRNFEIVYVAVDLSQEVLDMASSYLRHEFPELKVETLLVDFEKESLSDELIRLKHANHCPNFLLNIGDTLGNYVNVGSVLTNFLESMTLDDYLLVGNGLANDYNPQRILEAYNVEPAINFVTAPAHSLGLYGADDNFKFIWNPARNRVEGRLKLADERQVQLAGQTIRLSRNEEILLSQSNKYSEASLTKLLSGVGFRTELLTTTKDRSHILALVQPTRYSAS